MKVAPTDLVELVAWKKIDSRGILTILDEVKNHIVPHLSGKKTAREMWTALESLYQSNNQNRKMVLQERIRSTGMGVEEWCLISQGSHRSEMRSS